MITNHFIDLKEIMSIGLPRRLPRLDDFKLTNVHDDGPSADVVITSKMRYPAPAAYPPGITNAHGEIEILGEVEATHWYVEADGITWHIVTTRQPGQRTLCRRARPSGVLVCLPQPDARPLRSVLLYRRRCHRQRSER